ncbi:CoA transferase [Streptomyces sp. WP-1]|uniref:CoA transferase n=1 Tax=Streptomyces sp. WP-1 TaxID=3041497 RepID=UPI001317D1AF|nr:CoA transferase [Streptomyces sp. WP-1]QHC32710.1 carnitine dehydratase [Streptomyces sp. HF10]WKE68218.1 CoA transferase [Streptomyces sp. WP-1]
MDLTGKIKKAIAAPATDDAFDVHAATNEVLAGIGLKPGDTGGRITFEGADPVVPSTLRLGAASGIALVAKSAAVAALWKDRTGRGQDIHMDLRVGPHRLCPFYDGKWELINGYVGGTPSMPNQAFANSFYRTADDRWMMPFNIYPNIKVAAQRLLGVGEVPEDVAAAISRWNARDLEQAGAEAGCVMPMVRTPAEILEEEQYQQVLSGLPLVEITRIGDSDPEPLPADPTAPFDGVRALGMGHIIAGAGAGRALALHGADVLNLWRPYELEHDVTYLTTSVGVRSATVSPYTREGLERIHELQSGADVFYANRRPGFLDSIGLSEEESVARRPGLIHATVSLNGRSGPWKNYLGFDQTAGALTGLLHLEGDGDKPALPPITVVNDYLVSWFLTTGIAEALRRRAVDGGSYRVHVSLSRVALWILSMGIFDASYAEGIAGTGELHAYPDPEVFTAETPLGHYQGVTDQVKMSDTPGAYRQILVPRGSQRAEWLPSV